MRETQFVNPHSMQHLREIRNASCMGNQRRSSCSQRPILTGHYLKTIFQKLLLHRMTLTFGPESIDNFRNAAAVKAEHEAEL